MRSFTILFRPTRLRGFAAAALTALAACAAQPQDNSGITVARRTPDEFCHGTARSIAVDRYDMKQDGTPLEDALQQNADVALIEEITKAVYAPDVRSEEQAADAGTAACLRHFS